MKNLWNSAEAAGFAGDIGQRVYTSRLIGRDPSLVLHGGGNTSVKVGERNLFVDEEQILHVKGTGWDLAAIEPRGFSPCRMAHLLRLAGLDSLSDVRMVAELRGSMTNASAPTPSVEAILHAIIPARFVDHTHADAIVTVMNTPGGEDRLREIYGDRVVIVPYVMPGFKLARLCATLLPQKVTPRAIGVALMSHGLITFGETAESSYARMIECVTLAEEYLSGRGAWKVEWPAAAAPSRPLRAELAAFRRELSGAMRAPSASALRAGPTSPRYRSRARPRPTTSSARSGYRSSGATWRRSAGIMSAISAPARPGPARGPRCSIPRRASSSIRNGAWSPPGARPGTRRSPARSTGTRSTSSCAPRLSGGGGRCPPATSSRWSTRSEEHTSELQSPCNLVCRLLLEKKKQS